MNQFTSSFANYTQEWVLRLIEELGIVPPQYFKKLVGTEDIWEVRISYGNDIFRLLGFFDGGQLVVLQMALPKRRKRHQRRKLNWPSSESGIIFRGESDE